MEKIKSLTKLPLNLGRPFQPFNRSELNFKILFLKKG